MTTVIINPGTGPVPNSKKNHAKENIKKFVEDLNLSKPKVKVKRAKERDYEGRFGFELSRGFRTCTIDVPGIAYTGDDPYAFPRLYVDDSSWYWNFAIGIVEDILEDHDGAIEKKRNKAEKQAYKSLKKEPMCKEEIV